MDIELIEAPATALTLPQRAAVALGSSEHEIKLRELIKSSADIVEVKNVEGRDQVHRVGMTLRNTRVEITRSGKEAREDATKFSQAVIAEEKRLVAIITPEEDRIFALRDAFDAKVEEDRQAAIAKERARVENIRRMIDTIRNECVTANGKAITWLQERLSLLESEIPSSDFYAEFYTEAVKEHALAIANVRVILDMAIAAKIEADRQQAEREAEAARIAAERAENERIRAELEAQRKAQEVAHAALMAESLRLQAIEDAKRQAERDAQAKQAAEAAKQAAIELQAARDRQAEERAAIEHERATARAEAAKIQAQQDADRRAHVEAENARLQLERQKLADAQAELARQQAEIAETKRLQEEAADAERARQAHAEQERLDALQREADEVAAQVAARNQKTDDDDLASLTQAADEVLTDGRGVVSTEDQEIVWSINEEIFQYDCLDDLLASNKHLEAGETIYFGVKIIPSTSQLCDADDIMDLLRDRGYDIAGELAEDFPDASKEDIAELDTFISSWIIRCTPPTFFTVGNIQKYTITEADC